jgi:hypothetical protein
MTHWFYLLTYGYIEGKEQEFLDWLVKTAEPNWRDLEGIIS